MAIFTSVPHQMNQSRQMGGGGLASMGKTLVNAGRKIADSAKKAKNVVNTKLPKKSVQRYAAKAALGIGAAAATAGLEAALSGNSIREAAATGATQAYLSEGNRGWQKRFPLAARRRALNSSLGLMGSRLSGKTGYTKATSADLARLHKLYQQRRKARKRALNPYGINYRRVPQRTFGTGYKKKRGRKKKNGGKKKKRGGKKRKGGKKKKGRKSKKNRTKVMNVSAARKRWMKTRDLFGI